MRALIVVVTLVLTAQTALFAQVTYEELRAQLEEGANEEILAQMIRAEGLAFDVDKKVLRQMKRDKFPDWLIDLAIELDQGVVSEPIVSAYGGGRNYSNYYHDHYHPFYGHNYWWWDYWDYAWYGPASVFGFWGLGYPYNQHYYGYRYLNLRRPSGTVTRGGYQSPHDDNYRGPARTRVVRDGKTQVTPRTPAAGGNSGNSGTRVTRGRNSGSSAPSRSSSSGGSRVTRGSGYQGSSTPPARSGGSGRSARRK